MERTRSNRLLIVGNPGEVHVGAHLLRAAASLGLDARLCDTTEAFAGPAWRRRVDWWARGRRPARLREFSAKVVDVARAHRPHMMIATGIAPLDRGALTSLAAEGVALVNVLTDDPWNPAHRAPWFLEALAAYDHVFTPRQVSVPEIEAVLGRGRASYLPFAYAPDVHFPEPPADEVRPAPDVMFAGGADGDRVRILARLIAAGLDVALYGGYWDRSAETRGCARGMLDAAGLRAATRDAKVCLCLVRRANRDSHSMRSFEIPAMRGCVVAERTDDHRVMFGEDGTAAGLFDDVDEAIEQIRALVRDPDRRIAMARAGHARVTTGGNTYRDRLAEMLRICVDAGDARWTVAAGAGR